MDVRRQFLLRLEKQLQYTLQSGQIRKQQKLGLAFHLDGRAPERVHDMTRSGARHPEAAGALIFPTRTDTTKTYQ